MASKKPSGNQKTASAPRPGANRRAELRAQQLQAAKRRRRNRLLVAVAAVVALALIIWAVIWLVNRSKTSPTPTDTSTSSPTAPPVNALIPPDSNTQDLSTVAWITVPTSNKSPGALLVDIHTDYQCPFCGHAEQIYASMFEQLSDQGDISLRQHIRAFLDGVGTQAKHDTNTSSTKAAVAVACVDVADRTKFAAYHNALFINQPVEGAGFTDQQLSTDFATAAGLSGDALTNFQSCFASQATLSWVRAVETNNMGTATNPDAPPTYLYGGKDKLCYVTSGNSWVPADCSAKGAQQKGVITTPYFFVNGVAFGLSDLVDNNWTPKFTTAADLLTFLQNKAKS